MPRAATVRRGAIEKTSPRRKPERERERERERENERWELEDITVRCTAR